MVIERPKVRLSIRSNPLVQRVFAGVRVVLAAAFSIRS